MEDFYGNNSSSFSYDNKTANNNETSSIDAVMKIINVVDWIIICSGLPLTLVAIAAVLSLVKKDFAPVFIINLLMSDLVQLCCLAALKAGEHHDFIYYFYVFGVIASVGFMVCISLERYLMITQPLWFRFRRNNKTSGVVCMVVWILPLVLLLPVYFTVNVKLSLDMFAVFFLLPLPLFVFCLVGAVRALSAAHSVPADEKRRIVAVLVLVLLIYTLLFLPGIILLLAEDSRNLSLRFTTLIFLKISPLMDLTLYVFIRKGVADKLLASLCCCKMSTNQQTSNINNLSASSCQTI